MQTPNLPLTESLQKAQKLLQYEKQFVCPITLDIIEDPVFIPNTETEHVFYERNSLEMWFTSHHTVPITNTPCIPRVKTNQYYTKCLKEYKEKVARKSFCLAMLLMKEDAGLEMAVELLDHAIQLMPNDQHKIESHIAKINCLARIPERKDGFVSAKKELLLMAETYDFMNTNALSIVDYVITELMLPQKSLYPTDLLLSMYELLFTYESYFRSSCKPEQMEIILSDFVSLAQKAKINHEEAHVFDSFLLIWRAYPDFCSFSLLINCLEQLVSTVEQLGLSFFILQAMCIQAASYPTMDEAFLVALSNCHINGEENKSQLGSIALNYFEFRNNLRNIHDNDYEFGERFLRQTIQICGKKKKILKLFLDYSSSGEDDHSCMKYMSAAVIEMIDEIKLMKKEMKQNQVKLMLHSLQQRGCNRIRTSDQQIVTLRRVPLNYYQSDPFMICSLRWHLGIRVGDTVAVQLVLLTTNGHLVRIESDYIIACGRHEINMKNETIIAGNREVMPVPLCSRDEFDNMQRRGSHEFSVKITILDVQHLD